VGSPVLRRKVKDCHPEDEQYDCQEEKRVCHYESEIGDRYAYVCGREFHFEGIPAAYVQNKQYLRYQYQQQQCLEDAFLPHIIYMPDSE
jgi:hypothetical protein